MGPSSTAPVAETSKAANETANTSSIEKSNSNNADKRDGNSNLNENIASASRDAHNARTERREFSTTSKRFENNSLSNGHVSPPKAKRAALNTADIFQERKKTFKAKETLEELSKEEQELKRELKAAEEELKLLQEEKRTNSLHQQRELTRILEAFGAALQCSQCMQLFVKPTILIDCGHVFCEMCFRKHRSMSDDRKCPKCKKDVRLNADSYNFNNLVEALKDDFAFMQGNGPEGPKLWGTKEFRTDYSGHFDEYKVGGTVGLPQRQFHYSKWA